MTLDAVFREFPEKTLGKLIVSGRNRINPVTRSVHQNTASMKSLEKPRNLWILQRIVRPRIIFFTVM
jgi:hypothetical protein